MSSTNTTMNRKIKKTLLEILADYTDEDLTQLDQTATFSQIGIDSLSLVEIIFDLEEKFDITIPPEADLTEQGVSLQHFDDIVALVSSLCEQKK